MADLKRIVWVALFIVLTGVCSGFAAPADTVVLAESEVRATVERYLEHKLEGRGWETTVRQIALPYTVRIPAGPRELELIVPPAWEGWGPVTVALIVRVNGVVEKNIAVRLHVDVKADLVVAARQIAAGTVLDQADLQLHRGDLALAGGYPVTSLADAIGKKSRVSVRAGQPLKSSQLAQVPVVVSGQLVTIVAENAGLRISIAGRAKSSGGVGEVVRVQNMSSGKELPARVLDASTVEVGF